MMQRFLTRLGKFWCAHFHGRDYYPINGEVQCAICQRRRPVAWANTGTTFYEQARRQNVVLIRENRRSWHKREA